MKKSGIFNKKKLLEIESEIAYKNKMLHELKYDDDEVDESEPQHEGQGVEPSSTSEG